MPKAIPPVVMAGLFASASWLEVWDYIPHQARPYVLAGYIALTIASPLLARGKSVFVREKDALKLLDEQSGSTSRPATMLKGHAGENITPEALSLWQYQQERLLREWAGKLKGHTPSPEFTKFWTRALLASVLAAFGTGIAAGDQRIPRLLEAFDSTAPAVIIPPPDVKAWIVPPKGVAGLKSAYLGDKGDLTGIHEKSILHITIVGIRPKVTLNGHEIVVGKTIASKEADRITYQYTPTALAEGRNEIVIAGGPAWVVNVTPDHDPVVVIGAAGIDAAKPGVVVLECKASDDHGIAGGQIVLGAPQTVGQVKEQDIPASARLPRIALAGQNFCEPLPSQ